MKIVRLWTSSQSASGVGKFIGVLNRRGMKLLIKLGGFMSVKAKLFEGLPSSGEHRAFGEVPFMGRN